jgi:hypothetical protein
MLPKYSAMRLIEYRTMQKQSNEWLIPGLLAAGAAIALWYYWAGVTQPTPELTPVPEPVAETPVEPPGPLHPLATEDSEPGDQPELVPLPPLDQSDEYLKLEIAGIFGDSVDDMLADSGLIERIVATIDNLPRSHVAERIRPIGGLQNPFLVDGQDGSGEYFINPDNYHRYDALVTLASTADLASLIDIYRRFYPLFQDAYVSLGYPDGYFNDRLVQVIDHLLATPEIVDPIELVRPHVLYEYSDPDLEALSSGQKLLLRMGTDNGKKIKDTLREVRGLVTTM